jgi:hypothetical protein
VRKWLIVAAIAAGCCTSLLVGCAPNGLALSRSQDATAQTVASAGSSPIRVTCAQVAPSPTWLPPLVTAAAVSCVGAVRKTQYTLAGAANASTIAPRYRSGHPATTILLLTYVGVTELNSALQDQYTNAAMVTLPSGIVARLTTMTNGYGPVRIEWTRGSNSYLLLSVHGVTAEGASGVPTDDLLKIADSIPTK